MGVLEINTPLEKVSRTLSFKKKIVENFSLQRIVSVFFKYFLIIRQKENLYRLLHGTFGGLTHDFEAIIRNLFGFSFCLTVE